MLNTHDMFKSIFRQVSDYADLEDKFSEWAVDIYALLEKNKKIVVGNSSEDKGRFIYAVTLAWIVGEFGKFAFGDYPNEDAEINLTSLELSYDDLEGYLEAEMAPEHHNKLRAGNYVGVQDDLLTAIFKYKKEIHRALSEIYKAEGKKDPNLHIHELILKLFVEKNEDKENVLPSSYSDSNEMGAYLYVQQGFAY